LARREPNPPKKSLVPQMKTAVTLARVGKNCGEMSTRRRGYHADAKGKFAAEIEACQPASSRFCMLEFHQVFFRLIIFVGQICKLGEITF
jgi:hypothetical protein